MTGQGRGMKFDTLRPRIVESSPKINSTALELYLLKKTIRPKCHQQRNVEPNTSVGASTKWANHYGRGHNEREREPRLIIYSCGVQRRRRRKCETFTTLYNALSKNYSNNKKKRCCPHDYCNLSFSFSKA